MLKWIAGLLFSLYSYARKNLFSWHYRAALFSIGAIAIILAILQDNNLYFILKMLPDSKVQKELYTYAILFFVIAVFFEAWAYMEGEIAQIYATRRKNLSDLFRRVEEGIESQLGKPSEEGIRLINKVEKIAKRHLWLEHLNRKAFDSRAHSCRALTIAARSLYCDALNTRSNAPGRKSEGAQNIFSLRPVQDFIEYRTRESANDGGHRGNPIDNLQGDLSSFMALAVLCESLLEDTERSHRILQSYSERSQLARVQVGPARVVRLIRLGQIEKSVELLHSITAIVKRGWFLKLFSDSTDYGWRLRGQLETATAVALAGQYEEASAVQALKAVSKSRFARILPDMYLAGSAEVHVLLGNRDKALDDLTKLEQSSAFMPLHCGTALYLYRRLQEEERAIQLRSRVSDWVVGNRLG